MCKLWAGHATTSRLCPKRLDAVTCPDRDVVLRNQWSECNFTTCSGQDAVLGRTLVGTQFYDIPGLELRFTTCPRRDAVIQHVLVATQFYYIYGRNAVL